MAVDVLLVDPYEFICRRSFVCEVNCPACKNVLAPVP